MKGYIISRVLDEFHYLTDKNTTIRHTAKAFGVSKSTVHKDISHRLYFIDKDKYAQAKKLLEQNFEIKHIRGGESTKQKYTRQKPTYFIGF